MIETEWVSVERPGYLGSQKDKLYGLWNAQWGEGNWRLRWLLSSGQLFNYPDIFWKVYVPGYAAYFLNNPTEAVEIAATSSYTIDKQLVTKHDAFDPFALWEKPGTPNQFHNVALNIALEYNLGLQFAGDFPLQVREGKPGTDPDTWPRGWKLSPSRIPTLRPDLIPQSELTGWWKPDTIEDLYQKSKILQVRREVVSQYER